MVEIFLILECNPPQLDVDGQLTVVDDRVLVGSSRSLLKPTIFHRNPGKNEERLGSHPSSLAKW